MVHRGLFWPTNIYLRIYTSKEAWPEWIPETSLMSAFNWAGTINLPGDLTDVEATLYDFTIGDMPIEYRSAQVGPGPEVIQVGWTRRLKANHVDWETICQVWVDDAPQFLWTPNVFDAVTWSNWGPTFPLLNKDPAAVAWPTSDFGQTAKPW